MQHLIIQMLLRWVVVKMVLIESEPFVHPLNQVLLSASCILLYSDTHMAYRCHPEVHNCVYSFKSISVSGHNTMGS